MDNFLWVYFGEAELDFAGRDREGEVETDTPSAEGSGSGSGSGSEAGGERDAGYAEGFQGDHELSSWDGIDGKEVPGVGTRVEDTFQSMLDCLPLLGE
jgi:hypothetical protein